MKKSLALILTFIMVLALVPSVALAEGEEGKVTITKALVSSEPDNDGNYTIKLTVQGNPVTQNVQPNADVVLVIDCSGSMDENNRMKTAKKAAAWPEDVRMAATPPSSSAIFLATASLVGFWRRV